MQLAIKQNESAKKGVVPLLDVRVIRSTAEPNRFWWLVRELEGKIIESSPRNYSSEAEARYAAEAAARAVGRRKSLES